MSHEIMEADTADRSTGEFDSEPQLTLEQALAASQVAATLKAEGQGPAEATPPADTQPAATTVTAPANSNVSPFPVSVGTVAVTTTAPPATTTPAKGSYSTTTVTAKHEQPIPESVDPLLTTILSWPRCHDSKSEQKFCKWLRETIKQMSGRTPRIGALGCIIVEVPYETTPTTPSTTMFSCHVDTIDPQNPPKDHGNKPFKKKLNYDPMFGEIFLEKDSVGGSLGADDGVGVWIMLKMLEKKIPGTYVFHRGEELGCLGSKAMLDKERKWLSDFEAAIAFDRGGDYEIITHQGSQRCASDKYCSSLLTRLNALGMQYELSTRGAFTDTKTYRSVIDECVNIGVGYTGQHHPGETLDYAHAFALMNAVLQIPFDALPIERDCTVVEAPPSYGSYGGGNGYGYGRYGRGGVHMDGDFWDVDKESDTLFARDKARMSAKASDKKDTKVVNGLAKLTAFDELKGTALDDIEAWIGDDPTEAANVIGRLIVEIAELRAVKGVMADLAGLSDV